MAALLDSPRPGSYLPDVLDPDEVERILDAPPPTIRWGSATRAILELLYACGLRVSELTGLDTDRLDLDGLQVRVIGKGNRERRVPMGEPARERLHRYLTGPRAAWTAGKPTPAVFVSQRGATAGARIGLAHGAALGGGGRGGRGTSRRTPFGTASRPICWRAEPICGWSRRSLAMLASAPPSSTRT